MEAFRPQKRFGNKRARANRMAAQVPLTERVTVEGQESSSTQTTAQRTFHTSKAQHKQAFRQQQFTPSSKFSQRKGLSYLKQQIRSIKRLLQKEGLEEAIKKSKAKELERLELELTLKQQANKNEEVDKKYKHIKFFERRKVVRKLEQLTKKLALCQSTRGNSMNQEEKEIRKAINKWNLDLDYIDHFPSGMKYVSLFRNIVPPATSSTDDKKEKDEHSEEEPSDISDSSDSEDDSKNEEDEKNNKKKSKKKKKKVLTPEELKERQTQLDAKREEIRKLVAQAKSNALKNELGTNSNSNNKKKRSREEDDEAKDDSNTKKRKDDFFQEVSDEEDSSKVSKTSSSSTKSSSSSSSSSSHKKATSSKSSTSESSDSSLSDDE